MNVVRRTGARTCVSALVAIAVAAAACGDGGGDLPRIETSVPGDKPIGDLSDGEFQTLCNDQLGSAVFRNTRPKVCQFGAMLILGLLANTSAPDQALQEGCAALAEECASAMGSCTKPTPACRTTVGQYDACLADNLTTIADFVPAEPTCSDLTGAKLEAFFARYGTNTVLPDPPSCEPLRTTCPEIFDQQMQGLLAHQDRP